MHGSPRYFEVSESLWYNTRPLFRRHLWDASLSLSFSRRREMSEISNKNSPPRWFVDAETGGASFRAYFDTSNTNHDSRAMRHTGWDRELLTKMLQPRRNIHRVRTTCTHKRTTPAILPTLLNGPEIFKCIYMFQRLAISPKSGSIAAPPRSLINNNPSVRACGNTRTLRAAATIILYLAAWLTILYGRKREEAARVHNKRRDKQRLYRWRFY